MHNSPVKILSQQTSALHEFLREMRDENIQTDRMRFRKNMERVGMLMAYEISKQLPYVKEEVNTLLGEKEVSVLSEQPVIISILRAGIPFHQGFLEVFDQADNGFISAYRHHTKGNEFIVKVEYAALPDLNDRIVIIVDPMIATGKSMVLSCQQIIAQYGQPRQLYIAAVISSEEGIQNVMRHFPQATLYTADIDYELTAKSYIVPGLGDAGDLAFGPK